MARPKMIKVRRVVKAIYEKRGIFQEGIRQFLTETAVHGMKYFVDSHILVKLIWVSILKFVDLNNKSEKQLKFSGNHLGGEFHHCRGHDQH